MNNLISKASVCEILADIYPTDGEKVVAVKEVDKAYEAIQQLPSAQPEIEERMSETEQNVPNDDFISRKGAIDAIEAVFPVDPMKSEYAQGIACGAALSKTYIEQLPSAQSERKKGRWLNINESEKWECSECGRMMWFSSRLGVKPSDYKFCPNCGADMRESVEQNDNDK